MNQEINVNCEPLPGYRLIERLGSGGYGEVWRAEAPGGLTKAIKFVFGQQHEKRASNELRALDHIRSVRHPFLLSLERIEVVDGRLLVVTELADRSIKDRFDQCRRDGLRGIPRDELVGYLRDTADALDFMSETHTLQHLDIKPENLLLLAGHVKVADFGLVKDVRQSQASLVGGMTPLYAAPEVFRGVPSRHSDQYSLAIVFQEMLTGTLPFAGSNAAELTLQHLNDEPNMSALAASDRYAVSRALSKDPEHRYVTCRAFIEALANVASGMMQFQSEPDDSQFASPVQYTDDAPQPSKTELFDDGESADWHSTPQLLAELPPSDCHIVDLPPIDLASRDPWPVPTLVLGIGGTAGRVLTQLRGMIHDQFSGNCLPAVQLLLLDTETQSHASHADNDCGSLTADEMLNLPLRRPQHYRENSQQLLHWLSRRWLYNIPRSLRTEGLRPLGRLALVDHARQAGQRIRRAIAQAISDESLAASKATTGQEFRLGELRVMIVASISGGTGGGMALDIGYAVRAIVQKLGIAEAKIIGLMMHSTDRDTRHSELARVNAFSWLSEFHHFQQPDNPYPGDASCGLPPHAPGVTAFNHTYLLHLGENLDATEFEQATQAVAQYVRLNAISPAGVYFDACRHAPLDKCGTPNELPTTNLRSFGVSQRVPASREFCDHFAGIISQQVLTTWLGAGQASRQQTGNGLQGAGDAIDAACDSDCNQFIRRLQLDAAGIVSNGRALVENQLGEEPAKFLASWFEKTGAVTNDHSAQYRAIDQIFNGRCDGSADDEISVLGTGASAIISPLAEKLRAEMRRWTTHRIDQPRQRVNGARQVVQWIIRHLGETRTQLQQRQSALTTKISQLTSEAVAPTGVRNGDIPTEHSEYFRLWLDRVATYSAQHVINLLSSDAKSQSDEITALGREIDQIASAVVRASSRGGASINSGGRACDSPAESRLIEWLSAKLPAIAIEVDTRLQSEYLDPIGGLAKTIMQGGRPRAQLTAKLHELSRKAVNSALAGVDVLQTASGDADNSPNGLKSTMALATPTLLEYGGRRQTVAILPSEAASNVSQSAISKQLGVAITTIPGTDSSFTLCVEADQLSLPHIALDFVERRRDRIEFAGRVHCRTDIAWAPLIATAPSPDSTVWTSDEARGAQPQHALCKTLVL